MNREQLADAMLRGVKTKGVSECQTTYISVFDNNLRPCLVCALGSALVGHYDGDYRQAYKAWREAIRNQGEYDAFADLLDIDPYLALEVEHRHLSDQSIEQIATWLKGGE